MGACANCHKEAKTISDKIGYCADCIRTCYDEIMPHILKRHHKTRAAYGLPEEPPDIAGGLSCGLCLRECRIPEGGHGYCGIRSVKNGKLKGGRPHEGNLSYYHDPLPTNCVGSFACAAGNASGYPEYTLTEGPEYGLNNLAVFYHACSFNCLFCQNYHFKDMTFSRKNISAKALAQSAGTNTSCICFFGGDPTPQILHALKASRLAMKKAGDRILRVCWETNGAVNKPYLKRMAALSLLSGGCIKVDMKAWNRQIHTALCGVTNKRTLENFKTLSAFSKKRPHPPFLIASTLLVPGYVDEYEVNGIAKFIAELNPEIPYSLLAFYPAFYLDDLPTTSRSHADRCRSAAEAAGLLNVHIGNRHLIGDDY